MSNNQEQVQKLPLMFRRPWLNAVFFLRVLLPPRCACKECREPLEKGARCVRNVRHAHWHGRSKSERERKRVLQ